MQLFIYPLLLIVTAFGAFVDVGVHQDGLVHVSRIADTFVENPQAHLKPGQKVRVAVLEVDEPRKRIALSLRKSDLGEGGGDMARKAGAPQGRRRRERDDKPDLSMGSLFREQLKGMVTGAESSGNSGKKTAKRRA